MLPVARVGGCGEERTLVAYARARRSISAPGPDAGRQVRGRGGGSYLLQYHTTRDSGIGHRDGGWDGDDPR